MANGEGPFQPAAPEDLAQRKKDDKEYARKNIPEEIGKIKLFITKLKYVDCMDIDSLRSSIDQLNEYYDSLKDEEDIKDQWEGGMSQTLERLVALSNEVVNKYNAFIAELGKDNAFDKLIEELDQKA